MRYLGVVIGSALVITIIAVVANFWWQSNYGNVEDVTCTVEDKWVESSGGDSKTLVNCGGETFIIEDLLFLGKFNSSDLYGKIKVGEEYTLKVSGTRIPFLSHYRNINEVNE